jgi:hypothetical protein
VTRRRIRDLRGGRRGRPAATAAHPAPAHPRTPGQPALSAQERKILELIGEGLTNRQIGGRMFLAGGFAVCGHRRGAASSGWICRQHVGRAGLVSPQALGLWAGRTDQDRLEHDIDLTQVVIHGRQRVR